MIPTCFTTKFLAFNIYKGESSNINLSFHKQLKEAVHQEQKCAATFQKKVFAKRMRSKGVLAGSHVTSA